MEAYNITVPQKHQSNTKILRDEYPILTPKSKLVFPHQPYHDDFLDTMRKVFLWARGFGVAGPEKGLWRIWGLLMIIFLLAIEAGAIFKLIKLLAGLTLYSDGNRSVTARVAGAMFYSTSFMSLILSWRLSNSWNKISADWASVERRLSISVPTDGTLKRRVILVMIVMATCSAIEHLLSIISNVELDCPPSLILEKYILTSHGFLFIKSDYSTWLAIIVVFMSNVATVLWNFQDLIIVVISMGLTSRYYRLNQCVAKLSTLDNQEIKWTKNTEIMKVYMWRKIREAYVKQAMLVRRVDSAIGWLILLTSFGNFYFICLQLFLGITQGLSGPLIKRLYYMVSLAWLCLRFCYVILAAADVNVNSKKALRYLHGCNSRCFNIEVERLQKQLTKDFVALSGMGFFYLDRNVLLQIVGAIITYELVLIQFDGHSAGDQNPFNITLKATTSSPFK